MGFEQLAKLKEQLAKEASAQRKQKAESAKPAGNRHAGKPADKGAEKAADKGADRGASRRADKGPDKGPQKGPNKGPHKGAAPQGGAARPAAKQNPVDPVVHTIGKLQKRFPAAFPKNPAPKVALKIGVLEDLLAQAADMKLTEQEVRDAVSTWCRGSRYWASLTEGASRVDLSGAEVGKVTASDSAFARRRSGGRVKTAKPEGDAAAVATAADAADAAAAAGSATGEAASADTAAAADATDQPAAATDAADATDATDAANGTAADTAAPGTAQ